MLVENFWDPTTCDQVTELLITACSRERPWELFPHAPDRAFLAGLATQGNVVEIAERYLETTSLYLAGSHFQARFYGDSMDRDQPLHLDEGTNTLLVQPRARRFGYLVFLSYWVDITADNGPTYIVTDPAALVEEVKDDPDINFPHGDPKQWFKLDKLRRFEAETPVLVRRGSVLIYNLNLIHRGSKMQTPGAKRYVSWFMYKPQNMEWAGESTYGYQGNHQGMVHFMETASPRQRHLVGIPLPGHPFWTEETIERVHKRYPNMDMQPYKALLDGAAA